MCHFKPIREKVAEELKAKGVSVPLKRIENNQVAYSLADKEAIREVALKYHNLFFPDSMADLLAVDKFAIYRIIR